MKKNIKTKTHNLYKIIFLFVVFLGIGYAFLEANLNINGDVTVEAPELNVYVQSTSVTSGSTTGTPTIIGTDKKEVDFSTALTSDSSSFFEETTTLVNKGSKDAYLLSINVKVYDSSNNEVTLSAPYEYTLTHGDGTPVNIGEEVATNGTITYKLKFNYITGTDMNTVTDYPTYTFKITYVFGVIPVYMPGSAVYYDPVTNEKCDTYDVDDIKNGTSTCYKWRVITVDDTISNNSIKLQLDHNIVNMNSWVSKADYNDDQNFYCYSSSYCHGNTNKGPITLLKELEAATSGWNDVLKLNYSYNTTSAINNYGSLTCTNGICTLVGETITTNLKARIITGEEVADIIRTKNSAMSWSLSDSKGSYNFSNDNLTWLLENTWEYASSGATSNIYGVDNVGYWTLSPVSDDSRYAWTMVPNGCFMAGDDFSVVISSLGGTRPVIEISKSILY